MIIAFPSSVVAIVYEWFGNVQLVWRDWIGFRSCIFGIQARSQKLVDSIVNFIHFILFHSFPILYSRMSCNRPPPNPNILFFPFRHSVILFFSH